MPLIEFAYSLLFATALTSYTLEEAGQRISGSSSASY